MANDARSSTDDPGRSCVFAVPDTNDWYLTTDDSVILGPYRSCQEAELLLGLLRANPRAALSE